MHLQNSVTFLDYRKECNVKFTFLI